MVHDTNLRGLEVPAPSHFAFLSGAQKYWQEGQCLLVELAQSTVRTAYIECRHLISGWQCPLAVKALEIRKSHVLCIAPVLPN